MTEPVSEYSQPRICLWRIKQNPFWCLPIDCSHKAVRKWECQRKRRAGESLIRAERGRAASMQGQQLWSLGEVSVRRSQSVQHTNWSETVMIYHCWNSEKHVTTAVSPQQYGLWKCRKKVSTGANQTSNAVEGKCLETSFQTKGTVKVYIYCLSSRKMLLSRKLMMSQIFKLYIKNNHKNLKKLIIVPITLPNLSQLK